MTCKNLLKRQRHLKIVFYCKEYKKYIDYKVDCKNCSKTILKRNKGIKKVSDKKVTVKKEIYDKVIERDKYKCRLLDSTCVGGLQLHHIIYRSEDKSKINDVDNCIMLCLKHHQEVHSNKKKWKPILQKLVEKEK